MGVAANPDEWAFELLLACIVFIMLGFVPVMLVCRIHTLPERRR